MAFTLLAGTPGATMQLTLSSNTEILVWYYTKGDSIPKFINMLKDVLLKAEHAKMMLIGDLKLIAISSTAILAFQGYVWNTKDWEALTNAKKTGLSENCPSVWPLLPSR